MAEHTSEPLVSVESIRPKFDFKKWREHRKETEERLFTNLQIAFDDHNHENFRACLQACIDELEKLYEQLLDQSTPPHERMLKNDRVHLFFSKKCRTERSSEFLRIFLEQIPIVNRELERYTEAPPQSTPQPLEAPKRRSGRPKTEKEPDRAIHIAIKARAFENVRTLLNIPGVNVDAIWKFKNYTPLMMLISVVESDNFSKVKELVKHLADLKASINIGDFRMHPLSAICKLLIKMKRWNC
ncbi:hypothetical protein quinque_010168 [Culex quinquefasciatus]